MTLRDITRGDTTLREPTLRDATLRDPTPRDPTLRDPTRRDPSPRGMTPRAPTLRARRSAARRRIAGVVAASVAVVSAVAACGGSGSSSSSAATPTTVTATTTVTAAPSSTPSSSSASTTASADTTGSATTTATAASGSIHGCANGTISISTGASQAGLSHSGLPLLFTNTGSVDCALVGYPGAALVTGGGHQVQVPRTPQGYLGGISPQAKADPVVVLAPGQTGSALLEGEDSSASGGACLAYASLLVTAPNQTVTSRLARALSICSPQIHPVVAGTSGTQH